MEMNMKGEKIDRRGDGDESGGGKGRGEENDEHIKSGGKEVHGLKVEGGNATMPHSQQEECRVPALP